MRSARGSFQQRLFPSSRSRLTAESPPSDSVGFFFGLTPPDNHRSVLASSYAYSQLKSSPSILEDYVRMTNVLL